LGWSQGAGLSVQDRIKSDQRILGESEFAMNVLLESEGQFLMKYRLKTLKYDYEKVLARVSNLFHLEKDCITGKGRQRDRVMARDLLCRWSAAELGMSMVDLARKFDLTHAAVSCAVHRGEKMAKAMDYYLEPSDI